MNKILLFSVPLAFFLFGLPALQILILSVVWFAFGYFIDNVWTDYRFPAGPRGLPVIGSLHTMMYNSNDDEYLHALSKIYGGIYTIKFGPLPCTVISDYETMKEFTSNPNFQGRLQSGIAKYLFGGLGIIDSEGPRWKHQRRFMMHSLRDSGMGKMNMEEKINTQLENVADEMVKSNGKPLVLDVLLEKATCNVIFGLAFNKTFDFDDPVFISRIKALNETMHLTEILFFPTMFKVLNIFLRKYVKKVAGYLELFHSQSLELLNEHKESLDEDNPRDFLDLFLIEMKKDGSPEDHEYHSTFSEAQLKIVIFDLFLAGTETSSTTIRWAILYMLNYPEIQKKVQNEIDEVIGGNRTPTSADKLNLPFTVATLQEVERLASVVPAAIPRSNPAPAKFREYFFPERCMHLIHVYSIHRDPKLWVNPDEFNPGRFINKEGKVFRPPYLVPFGSGKRSCAGESLARMEIFLFFVTLMQKFTFLPPDGKIPELAAVLRGVRAPKPYSVVAQPRN